MFKVTLCVILISQCKVQKILREKKQLMKIQPPVIQNPNLTWHNFSFLLAIPIEIFQAATNYEVGSIATCVYLHRTKLAALFLAKLIVLHFIASFCIQRYLFIKSIHFWQKRHLKTAIAVLWLYTLGIFIPICYSLFTNNKQTERMCLAARKCPLDCSENCSPTQKTVLIILIYSITICNICIYHSVLMQRCYIRKQDSVAAKVLGKKRITNLTRVNATTMIGTCFSIAWIPYAVRYSDSLDQYTLYLVRTILRGVSYTSFLTVPFVYILMDKKFLGYIRSLMEKRSMQGIKNSDQGIVTSRIQAHLG